MTYLSAPQTRMLATHCVACGRPLVDAESVNTGMGPDCRKRHGYDQSCDSASRREVNQLVHRLSLWRSNSGPTDTDALEALKRVRELGFLRLVEILEQRLTTVQLEADGATFLVFTPYNENLVNAFKRLGMRWDKERKAWLFTPSTRVPKAILRDVLSVHLKGHLAVGPKGVFLLEAAPTKPLQTELPLAHN